MKNKSKRFNIRGRKTVWSDLLAAALGIITLYLSLIIIQISKDSSLSNGDYIFYLAVISPLSIVIIYLLLRFLNKENYRDLNLKGGTFLSDLSATFILSIVIIAANIVSQPVLSEFLPDTDTGVRDLFLEMAENPGRFLLFVGPLVLLGAASEELMRVFLLSRLWRLWPSLPGKLISVLISACLFGFLHLSRGPVHVAWTTLFGLLMAFYYLRFGRVLPLISAHYLSNAIQVVVTVFAFS